MEDIYTFRIDAYEFENMIAGKKTVHLVVNEPKRKTFAIGNQISFIKNVEQTDDAINLDEEVAKAEVEGLLYFADVIEAVETIGKEKCGFRPSATFEKTTDVFLSGDSFESIEKYGIMAIQFKLI